MTNAYGEPEIEIIPPKPTVGPGTYTPRYNYTKTKQGGCSFGKASRFKAQPNKSAYISSQHNSDQLCTGSPGPKYHPQGHPTRMKAFSWSMGPSTATVKTKDREAAYIASGSADVGPASYKPQMSTKPQSARAVFSKGDRFPDSRPYIHSKFSLTEVVNFKDNVAPGHYTPRDISTAPHAPKYSFGPKDNPKDRKKYLKKVNRANFLDHNIAGGLARPATVEACIGPGHYSSARTPGVKQRCVFGKAKRFTRQEAQSDRSIQFISKLHCMAMQGLASPGPKYTNDIGDVQHTARQKAPRSTKLNWL